MANTQKRAKIQGKVASRPAAAAKMRRNGSQSGAKSPARAAVCPNHRMPVRVFPSPTGPDPQDAGEAS